jgi:DNA-directed RNA polymerase specialized sigma24 family protein
MLDITRLAPLLKKIADSTASQFPTYVDRDDVESALYVWAYERRGMVSKIMTDSESWEARLYQLINRAAMDYALKEDMAVQGYSEDDTFVYTIEQLKSLLEQVWDYENWQTFGVFGEAGMPHAKGLVNQTGDRLAMLADVKRALDRISTDQYNILVWRYKQHLSLAELGEALEVAKSTAQHRAESAVRALQKELGQVPLSDLHKGHSGRSRGTTASALALQEQQYEG